jgi:hypothetical protein
MVLKESNTFIQLWLKTSDLNVITNTQSEMVGSEAMFLYLAEGLLITQRLLTPAKLN